MEFSVLMSVYSKEKPKYLNNAIRSIWHNQTLKPSEVVLVKDGPLTEELDKVIRYWKEELGSVLKIIKLAENKGLGYALNKGLENCNYKRVARMDTDDIAKPERFKKQIAYMKSNPGITVLGSWVEEFNEKPGDLDRVKTCPGNKIINNKAKYRNPLNHPTVMFSRKAVLKVGSYKEMCYFEDYYLWIRLLNQGYQIENIEESLLYFRIGNDMVGRRIGLNYLKCEWKFYSESYRIGFIGIVELIFILVTRLPIRLLPKSFIEFIYDKILRS